MDAKRDWGYAGDYVEAAYNIMKLKKPNYFVIGTGKAHSIEFFVKQSFKYVGLDYKKYTFIDKKLFRKAKNKTLVANTNKAKKIFNFKIKTDINKLIKIMMEHDLKLEK